jgi:hypothetical protein
MNADAAKAIFFNKRQKKRDCCYFSQNISSEDLYFHRALCDADGKGFYEASETGDIPQDAF